MSDDDFKTPSESTYLRLIHLSLDTLNTSVIENKRDLHKRLDSISENVDKAHDKISAVKEKVDTMGLDRIIGDVGRLEEKLSTYSQRLQKLESYHQRVMAIGSFVGFVLAVAAAIFQLIKYL